MVIVLPFLQMLERYNGMMMTPQVTDALEEAIATAPIEDQTDENLVTEIPSPRLTLVASR